MVHAVVDEGDGNGHFLLSLCALLFFVHEQHALSTGIRQAVSVSPCAPQADESSTGLQNAPFRLMA